VALVCLLGGSLGYLAWCKLFTPPPPVHNKPFPEEAHAESVILRAAEVPKEPNATMILAGPASDLPEFVPAAETAASSELKTVVFSDWTPPSAATGPNAGAAEMPDHLRLEPPPTLQPLLEPAPVPRSPELMPLPSEVRSADEAHWLARPAAVLAIWSGAMPASMAYLDEPAAVEEKPTAEPLRVVSADARMYTIVEGDDYWSISSRMYGTGSYFRALQVWLRDHHGNADPLKVGTAVPVPPVAELRATYPQLCPAMDDSRQVEVAPPADAVPVLYTVKPGDTLLNIAREELGRASRWSEIYQLNREAIDAASGRIEPGTQLKLPAMLEATAARATRLRFQ
jgi:LysM repeat protein